MSKNGVTLFMTALIYSELMTLSWTAQDPFFRGLCAASLVFSVIILAVNLGRPSYTAAPKNKKYNRNSFSIPLHADKPAAKSKPRRSARSADEEVLP